MTLQFKKTSDDPRKLIKNFTDIGGSVPGTNTASCSILNPVWLLEYNSDYKDATHVYCTEFGRTYYITDLVMGTGGKCYVYGAVDVLATYGPIIKDCNVCVTRSESAGVNWVTDSQYPINPNKKIVIGDKYLPTPFTSGSPCFFVDFSEYTPYNFELPQHTQPTQPTQPQP